MLAHALFPPDFGEVILMCLVNEVVGLWAIIYAGFLFLFHHYQLAALSLGIGLAVLLLPILALALYDYHPVIILALIDAACLFGWFKARQYTNRGRRPR